MPRKQAPDIETVSECFAIAKGKWRESVEARYKAAKTNRFQSRNQDIPGYGESADHHYQLEYDYFRMVETARLLDRDDPIAGPSVSRLVSNILQCGFTYDPQTGDRDADALLKLLWDNYSNDPDQFDYQQERTLDEQAELVLRDVIVAGDIVALPTNEGSVQVIENYRLRTPSNLKGNLRDMTIHGVRMDERRRRVSYFITRDDVAFNSFPRLEDFVEVPARNRNGELQAWHIYHPKRTTQTRGITKFASVTDTCTMHDDIQFAKLVQQQGVSVWTMVRERPLGFDAPDNVDEDVYLGEVPSYPGETRAMKNVSAGMWYTGLPGETVKAFSANVPSPTFFDHARQIQQLIAINLDLPLILLLLDASETNFSGWRGAMEQAKISFRAFQKWFARVFHERILQWKIRQWSDPTSPLANPLLVSMRAQGINVFGHEWIYPHWPYVEPLKDVSADLMEYQNGMISMRRIQARNGRDWDVVSSERADDIEIMLSKAIEKVEAIKQKYGVDVPLEYFAQMPMPQGISVSLDTQQGDQAQTTGGNANAN